MSAVRTFLAFDPPDDVRALLAALQERLRPRLADVRWVRPALFHTTITFLGDVGEPLLPALLADAGGIAARHPPFAVTYGGVGVFPDLRRPAVLWAGCAPAGEALALLKEELDAAIRRRGILLDDRPFRPHLTLGRFRSGAAPRDLTPTLESCTLEPRRSSVEAIRVMRSDLSPHGPTYSVLATFRLHERTSHRDA